MVDRRLLALLIYVAMIAIQVAQILGVDDISNAFIAKIICLCTIAIILAGGDKNG